jgi:hypothetical protein
VTLDFEMQKAARDLPLGWEIAVVCEKGAGWVELHNDEGDHVEFDTSPDRNLAEQVCDAVAYAIEVTSLETRPEWPGTWGLCADGQPHVPLPSSYPLVCGRCNNELV